MDGTAGTKSIDSWVRGVKAVRWRSRVNVAPHIPQPFKLDVPIRGRFRKRLFSMVAGPLEHTLGLATLNTMYAQEWHNHTDFLEKTLTKLGVRYAVSAEDLARVPKTGPCVVVSNHPFGGLDGVILLAILRRVRPDVKTLSNFILDRIPDMREMLISVDPFGGANAVRRNLAGMKQALAHLHDGHLLMVFPAGEVSHLDLSKRAIVDPAWTENVARLVRKTKAPVVPAFFDGANSMLFNLLGLVHPLLRTAWLPREFLNKHKKTIGVQIGTAIPYRRMEAFADNTALTAYLRTRTYLLQGRIAPKTKKGGASRSRVGPAAMTMEPIADARDPALFVREIRELPAEALVAEHGQYQVYIAKASQVPHILHEIGRQREIAFRAVAEGTGKALDLDRFDDYYHHLFLWNAEKFEVVGAYRLGCTDEILPRLGMGGLYTSTLFHYQAGTVEQFGPAMEVGRSFVRADYQKSYAALMLLWRGALLFSVRPPHRCVLFGAVSINNSYHSISRQLIMTFLQANNALPSLARCIRAKNPWNVRPPGSVDLKSYSTVVRDIDEVSTLVAEIEADQKGIPILLRQYLWLGAKFLGFNIDPTFGHVLDGLVLVDTRRTDPRIIQRVAGKEVAAKLAEVGRGQG